MTVQIKPLSEINQQAIHLLYEELGVVDAVRFLQQFSSGYGNYTKERRQIFTNETLDGIIREMKQTDQD
jgi:hypothetical protein